MANYNYNNQRFITILVFCIEIVSNAEPFDNQTTNDSNIHIEATTLKTVIDKITGKEDLTIHSINNKSLENTTSVTKSDTDTKQKNSGIKITMEFDF